MHELSDDEDNQQLEKFYQVVEKGAGKSPAAYIWWPDKYHRVFSFSTAGIQDTGKLGQMALELLEACAGNVASRP